MSWLNETSKIKPLVSEPGSSCSGPKLKPSSGADSTWLAPNNLSNSKNSIPQLPSRDPISTSALLHAPLPGNPPMGLQHRHEMFVPNDLIGCIIGRGGNKINEIRQTSQANIKISSGEEGLTDRRIVITGPLHAVRSAHYLISSSIELHKHLLALNMAMHSLYSGPTRSHPVTNPDPNPSPAISTKPMQREPVLRNLNLNPGPAFANSTRLEPGYSSQGWSPNSSLDSSSFADSCLADQVALGLLQTPQTGGPCTPEIRSAPAQLNPSNQSQSVLLGSGFSRPGTTTHQSVVGRKSRMGSVGLTPGMSTPFMSAAQLKDMTHEARNPVSEQMSPRQVLTLIGQLPQSEQTKWLQLFGFDTRQTD